MADGDSEDGRLALEQVARLLDSTPDAVLEVDARCHVVYANAAARALARERGDPVGRPLADAIDHGFGADLEGLVRQAASSGDSAADVVHPRTRRPYSARAFPCANGACLFLRALGPDVLPDADTRRVTAEAQLAALFRQAPIGFSYFDRNHRFVRINDWMADINGVPPADCLGRRVQEVLPEVAPFITPMLDALFTTGEAPPVHEVVGATPRQPGVQRNFLVGWFPVEIEGRVAFAGSVVTEITALRRAEAERLQLSEALEQERALLHAVIEQMPAGVIAIKVPDTEIMLYNEEAERLLGQSLGPLHGAVAYGDFSAEHPDGRPYAREDYPIAKTVLTGRPTDLEEVLYRRGDGTLTTLAVRAAPVVDAENRLRLAVATFYDISHRKAMEDALRTAKEDAERADRAKSRFLAAASHDLRQPMQSLFFFAESLRRHVSGEAGRLRLGQLQQALDALKGLLDSLLDVSRLDANMVEPRIEDVDLGALLEEIRSAYEDRAAERGLRFLMAPCNLWGRSDRTLLARILRNLVENALRYTEVGDIELSCRETGEGAILLCVRDTGIGIPAEHLERIWEEFHQVGNPERDRERGLGLGLAIVRRLAMLLDHHVDVRSEAGQGSVFSVTIPAGQPSAEPRPAEAPRTGTLQPAAGRLVLVVDDDAIVLMGTQAHLEDWGYETLGASSGDEAMDLLRHDGRCPDLILADYRLRNGELGTEVVQRVHGLCGDVPAVILTGETSPEVQRGVTGMGYGLTHKPVMPAQLRQALEEQVRRHRSA